MKLAVIDIESRTPHCIIADVGQRDEQTVLARIVPLSSDRAGAELGRIRHADELQGVGRRVDLEGEEFRTVLDANLPSVVKLDVCQLLQTVQRQFRYVVQFEEGDSFQVAEKGEILRT